MKVLIINGSPNLNGATFRAISEMTKVFEESSIDYEIVNIGNKDIR